MTAEKHLVCDKCKCRVYVCKNGRLDNQYPNDIASFIENHEHNCDGNMQVWDESCVPFEYEDYYKKGRSSV